MTIRDAESQGASQADSLHWMHGKSIQLLEDQAIQSKSHLDFLFVCQAAIQASPVELDNMLLASYHTLMEMAPMSHPFNLSQGASSTEQVSGSSHPLPSYTWVVHPNPSGDTSPQTQWMSCLLAGPCPKQPQKGPLVQKGKTYHPYTRC